MVWTWRSSDLNYFCLDAIGVNAFETSPHRRTTSAGGVCGAVRDCIQCCAILREDMRLVTLEEGYRRAKRENHGYVWYVLILDLPAALKGLSGWQGYMWPDVVAPWFSVYVRSDAELPMIDCTVDRGPRVADNVKTFVAEF